MRGEDLELYTKYILLGCSSKAMSAKELSDNYRIPIGSCYKLIRTLLSEGVLKCSITISGEGNVIPLFRICAVHESPVVRKH